MLHLLELLLVVLQLLGVGEHGVLRLPQLRGRVVQLILRRCLLPLDLGQLLFGTRHLLLQGGHLAPQPLQFIGPGENARRPGGRTAGHRAAGVEDLAVQGDNAEAVSIPPGHGHGLVQILGDDDAPQQIGHHSLIILMVPDELVGHAHVPGLGLQPRLPEGTRSHGVHGQEGGPATVPAFEPADGLLGVLVPLHHHVLHGTAQGDFNGHSIGIGHMDEPRHRAANSRQAAPFGLAHEQLDGFGISFVEFLHFGEHVDAGLEVVVVHLQAAVGLHGLLSLPLPGLQPHLVACHGVGHPVPFLHQLVQLALEASVFLLHVPLLGLLLQKLSGHVLLPVHQLLTRRRQGGQQGLGLSGGCLFQPLLFPQLGQLLVQTAHRVHEVAAFLLQLLQLGLAVRHGPLHLLQAFPALLHLLSQRTGPARLLLQLVLDALDVVRVVLLVPAQQLQLALSLVHLLLQVALGPPNLLGLHLMLLHLLGIAFRLLVESLQLLPQGLPVGGGGVQGGFQLDAAGSQLLQLFQPQGNLQPPQLVPHHQILLGLLRLHPQGLHLKFQLADFVVDAHQVFLGALELPLRLLLAVAVLGDARRLFKDLTPVRALHRQNLVDLALSDDGVALPAQTGIHKQLIDIPQAAGTAVDVVLTLSGAVVPPGHRHLLLLQVQQVLAVVQHQRHLCKPQALALGGAVKDDILHLVAPEGTGGLLPHHPPNGVGNIGFSRSVGAYNHGDIGAKGQHRLLRKGLKPLNLQRF